MSYTPGIPAANDIPSSSQGQIQTNFTQLNTIFDVDHVTFDAGADNGEHNKITLNSAIAADPNKPAPKASLYLKTIAADSELFFENFDVGGAVNVVRQVSNITATTSGALLAVRTVSGMLYTWGEVSFAAGNEFTPLTNFPVAYTTNVALTAEQMGGTTFRTGIQSISNTQFQLKRAPSTGTLTVKIIAIGI